MTARIHMLSASLAADPPLPNDVWADVMRRGWVYSSKHELPFIVSN